jgi:hypothetical protein
MTEIYTIYSESGDEYKLKFTTDCNGIIADALLEEMNSVGIEVAEIALARVKGVNVTSGKVLAQIEECIADLMNRYQNVILTFFCDFISFLPATKKKMPVQEYRSRLFTAMFERYMNHHHIDDFCNNVVKVEGVAEIFYFHVIYHKEHQKYAEMIAEGLQKDFGKPEQ